MSSAPNSSRLKYFAYGSNMSLARLKQRVPGARHLGCYALPQHGLRFHLADADGSAKCDAFFTGEKEDCVWGGLFEIDAREIGALDRAENLGVDYQQKEVQVLNGAEQTITAFTYVALHYKSDLKPYAWYLNHVCIGAEELGLPTKYVQALKQIVALRDPDTERALKEWAVHHQAPPIH